MRAYHTLKIIGIILLVGLNSCKKEVDPSIASCVVSTLAGSTAGSEDGPGSTAKFQQPFGVVTDAQGNVYVADNANHRIRKITSTGVVSTLAGATQGFADGIGITAKFQNPRGLAVDAQGNVYVADMGNERIRKITPTGRVSTLAGTGQFGFLDGPGSTARFDAPYGVATDVQGNVYVADHNNHRIRKITPAGVVSTLAGSTAGSEDGPGSIAKFQRPYGVATDARGNVYVADNADASIRKITSTGVVSTVADFNSPHGLIVDAQGNIYLPDGSKHSIRKITPTGRVSTLAGTGQSGFLDGSGEIAQFSFPYDIAIDTQGRIYIADTRNHRIRKIVLK